MFHDHKEILYKQIDRTRVHEFLSQLNQLVVWALTGQLVEYILVY